MVPRGEPPEARTRRFAESKSERDVRPADLAITTRDESGQPITRLTIRPSPNMIRHRSISIFPVLSIEPGGPRRPNNMWNALRGFPFFPTTPQRAVAGRQPTRSTPAPSTSTRRVSDRELAKGVCLQGGRASGSREIRFPVKQESTDISSRRRKSRTVSVLRSTPPIAFRIIWPIRNSGTCRFAFRSRETT